MKKKSAGFYRGYSNVNAGATFSGERVSGEDEIAKKVESYSSMSQEELLDELFFTAAEARRKGELSDEKLIGFYNTVKGMLDEKQRAKLETLIRALKEK